MKHRWDADAVSHGKMVLAVCAVVGCETCKS